MSGRAGHHWVFDAGGSELHFQEGPVREHGVNGVQAPEVLAAVSRYLEAMNVDPLANRETSLAITKIEEAIHWLDARTKAREARGVEGTSGV